MTRLVVFLAALVSLWFITGCVRLGRLLGEQWATYRSLEVAR